MGFISIALFLAGFFSFANNKKHITLLAIATLSTAWFGVAAENFRFGPIQLQHGDLALVLIFSLLPFRKALANKQLTKVFRALVLFLLFFVISVIYDYSFRGTTPMQIFRTTRKVGYLAFFFLIDSFSWRDYISFFKTLLVITCVHSILYVSQYLFGYNFNASDSVLNEGGSRRYRNQASYIIPCFVYALFLIRNVNWYKYVLVLFIVSIVLAQSRGAIISVGFIILLYLYLNKKLNLQVLILLSLVFLIGYTLMLTYFPIIGDRFGDAYEQVNSISDMNFDNIEFFLNNGSFIFRIGVTYERLIYVLKDIPTIILGVGYVPDIDIIKPIFTVGTASPLLPTGFEQYNSVDIFFPNIITRYGIVGSIIFLYFIFQLFVYSFKQRQYVFGKLLITYLVSMLCISLVNETFYNGRYFFSIFIMIGLIVSSHQKILIFTNPKLDKQL